MRRFDHAYLPCFGPLVTSMCHVSELGFLPLLSGLWLLVCAMFPIRVTRPLVTGMCHVSSLGCGNGYLPFVESGDVYPESLDPGLD